MNAVNGLKTLARPLLSIRVFSMKIIEMIGAKFLLSGSINHTPKRLPKIIDAIIKPKKRLEITL